MTTSQIQILSVLISRYDERDEPVTPAELAVAVDADTETVRELLVDFESKHLLQDVEDGYRPTVTARELLELDIAADALLILDSQSDA